MPHGPHAEGPGGAGLASPRNLAGLVGLLLLVGCDSLHTPSIHPTNPSSDRGGQSGSGTGGSGPSLPPPSDGGISLGDTAPAATTPPGIDVVVYAHSGSDLFKVDPKTLEVSRVGNFLIRGENDKVQFLNTVTDIAVDKGGRMTGITFTELLSINSSNAECTRLAPLSGQLNGLSWIRMDDGSEILAATGFDGSVLRIDPATGNTTKIGSLGNNQMSSGDIVSVATYGTLITLVGNAGAPDLLARLDPNTGAATVIGSTNFKEVWGIGFWGNRVFGFTKVGDFILIDPKTGEGKLVQKNTAYPFWGAGVSTSAPVID